MAFLAIVAVAAAGHAPSAGASRPSTPAPKLLIDYITTLSILVMPIGLILIVWASLTSRIYKDVPLKTTKAFPMPVRGRPLVQVAIIIASIAFFLRFHPFGNNQQGPPTAAGAPSRGRRPTDQAPVRAAVPVAADDRRRNAHPRHRRRDGRDGRAPAA